MQTHVRAEFLMPLVCVVLAAMFLLPSVGNAQQLSPVEAQAIAREAYIYGFPIVENYRSMHSSAIDSDSKEFKAPFNTLKHETNVFTPSNTAVQTPNADTPYSFLWIDLRAEPVVVGVPDISDERYYSIQLTDLFKFTFAYIGSRSTGNAAGRYLIVGPGWKGETPASITKVIRCETEFATAIYRTELRGTDDLASSCPENELVH